MEFGSYVTQMIGYVGDVMGNANINPYVMLASGALIVGIGIKYGKRIVRILKL